MPRLELARRWAIALGFLTLGVGSPGSVASLQAEGAADTLELIVPVGHSRLGSSGTLAISPDGRIAVTGSKSAFDGDGTVRLWETATGRELRIVVSPDNPDDSRLYGPRISHDGRLLLALDDSRRGTSIQLWDALGGRLARTIPWSDSLADPQAALFVPGASRLLVWHDDYVVRIWNLAGDSIVAAIPDVDALPVQYPFSPNGRHVALAHEDDSVRVWPTDGGPALLTVPGAGQQFDWTGAVTFSSSDDHVIVRGDDGDLRVWNLRSGAVAWNTVLADTAFSVSRIGDGVIVGRPHADSIALWNVVDGTRVGTHELQPEVEGLMPTRVGIRLSSDGGLLALTGATLPVVVFLRGTADPVPRVLFVPFNEEGWLRRTTDGMAVSPQGDRLVFIGDSGIFSVDTRTGVPTEHTRARELRRVWLSPDGETVLQGGSGSDFDIAWSTRTGEERAGSRNAGSGGRSGEIIAHSSDGAWLVQNVGGPVFDTLAVIDARTGREVQRLGPTLRAATFSPDSRWLAVGALIDSTVTVGQFVGGEVRGATSSRTERWILWDTTDWSSREASTEPVLRDTSRRGFQMWAAFSADGSTLVTASEDGLGRWRTGDFPEPPDFEASVPVRVGLHTEIADMQLSAAGRFIVASFWLDSLAHVLDMEAPAEWSLPWRSFDPPAFSPDGRHLLIDTTSRVDSLTGTAVYRLPESVGDAPTLVRRLPTEAIGTWAFRPGTDTVLVQLLEGGRRSLAAYDLGADELTRLADNAEDDVRSLGFSGDGETVLLSTRAGGVEIWDGRTMTRRHLLRSSGEVFDGVALDAGGSRGVSTARDRAARVWDLEQGREGYARFAFDQGDWALFTPDGQFDGSERGLEAPYYWNGQSSVALERAAPERYRPGLARVSLDADRPGTGVELAGSAPPVGAQGPAFSAEIAYWLDAADAFERSGRLDSAVVALSRAGQGFIDQGRPRSALAVINRGRRLGADETALAIELGSLRAEALRLSGDLAAALGALEEELEMRRISGDGPGATDVTIRLGSAYLDAGEIDDARAFCSAGRAEAEAAGLLPLAGEASRCLGELNALLGWAEEAGVEFRRAEDAFRRENDTFGLARVLADLAALRSNAEAHVVWGRSPPPASDSVMRYHDAAIASARDAGSARLEAEATLDAAMALLSQAESLRERTPRPPAAILTAFGEQVTRGRSLIERARSIWEELGDRDGEARAIMWRGIAAGLFPVSSGFLDEEGFAIWLDSDPSESVINADHWVHDLNRAIASSAADGDPLEQSRALLARAEAHVRRGERTVALGLLEAATELAERQPGSANDRTAVAYAEVRHALFVRLAALWLASETTGRADLLESLAAVERGRAQSLLRLLAPASEEEQGPATLATEVISDAASNLETHVVTYLLEQNALNVFVLQPQGAVTHHRVDARRDSLEHLIDRVSYAVTGGRSVYGDSAEIERSRRRGSVEPAGPEQWSALADALFPPSVLESLPGDGELLIVPEGPLAMVPFAALPVSERPGEPVDPGHSLESRPALGDSLALRYAPSVRVALELEQSEPGPRTGLALVVGNPEMPFVRDGENRLVQLDSLPGAAAEGRFVAELLETEVLTGSDATETRVRAALPTASVVHFATHGFAYTSDARARDSFVAFAPEGDEDGLFTVAEVMDATPPLSADLVVLSACQTGLGDVKQSEGTIGLQRAFLARGARAVLVSLWSVSDEATRLLMESFYRYWITEGLSKAESLRRAQKDLRAIEQYSDPRYWAAFQLVGAG